MLLLQRPELDDFELTVSWLMKVAHDSGGIFLRARGITPERLPENRKAHRTFLQKCHYGFDLAQRQIGKLVVDYERKARALTSELKDLRRSRDKRAAEIEAFIEVLRNRQLVLRRILDSILYAILLPDTWVQRRLTSTEEIRGIDPDVILRTLTEAVERNRADRLRFNLVADLTTVIHYGDLFEVNKLMPSNRKWRLLELKDGRINELILEELERQEKGAVMEDVISSLEAVHGPAVGKQARRMVKQQQRLSELNDIVHKGSEPTPTLGNSLRSLGKIGRLRIR